MALEWSALMFRFVQEATGHSLAIAEHTQTFLNINFLARYAYSSWWNKHPYLDPVGIVPQRKHQGQEI